MALWTRGRAGHIRDGRLEGLIHHSDAGCQCRVDRLNLRSTPRSATAQSAGRGRALASIGSVDDSVDNALAESLIGLYKTECVRRDGPIRSVEDLELATASWAHWFNTRRRHSTIGNIPPVEYEQWCPAGWCTTWPPRRAWRRCVGRPPRDPSF
jgi:putative transposase